MSAGAESGDASAPAAAAPAGPAGDDVVVREPKPRTPRKKRWTRQLYKAVVGWLAVGIAAVVRLLGPSIAMRLGRAGGLLAWRVRRAERETALANLAIAFPEKSEDERRRIARESFARVGMCAMEWIAVARRDDYIDATVLENREHLDAAHAKGKGVIWVTGHVANWELMAAATQRSGYPCAVIATTVRYPRVNELTIAERGRIGIVTLERESPTSGRELLKIFRRNMVLGLLMDHDTAIPSVQVDFFGRLAWTAIGPAELCVRFGAPAVSGFLIRDPDGRRHVPLGPPIYPPENVPKTDVRRAARDLTQQLTKRIEDHIRAHPEDWAWMHRRWRS